MKSPVVKRSIVIAGHKTSVSLEDAFWKGLKEIASGREATLSELVASIDADRQQGLEVGFADRREVPGGRHAPAASGSSPAGATGGRRATTPRRPTSRR